MAKVLELGDFFITKYDLFTCFLLTNNVVYNQIWLCNDLCMTKYDLLMTKYYMLWPNMTCLWATVILLQLFLTKYDLFDMFCWHHMIFTCVVWHNMILLQHLFTTHYFFTTFLLTQSDMFYNMLDTILLFYNVLGSKPSLLSPKGGLYGTNTYI